jgi:hypothetical protein
VNFPFILLSVWGAYKSDLAELERQIINKKR